ncbi:MAG: hypothetical protein LDL31_01595 [Prosthecobacter sp.]|nr:hypothetical protein [Prosthecobacter sp.]
MKIPRCIFLMPAMIWLASLGLAAERPQPSVPYSPSAVTDRAGNEWMIEQNGALQRSGTPSMIGNCMALQFANQQFYTQQPLCTPDGLEMLMSSPQAMGGVRITRRILVLEREAALLYVEELQNTTQRNLIFDLELRHHLNNQAREITSNLGRPIKDSLEGREVGIVALPAEGDKEAPALVFILRAAGITTPQKLRLQNKYQLAVPISVKIPAGETCTLIHAVAQPKLKEKADAKEIARACAPYALEKLVRHLRRSTLKLAVNLGLSGDAFGLADWFPQHYWGLAPATSDLLAMGPGTLLSGQATWQGLKLHRSGSSAIELEASALAALAGPVFTRDGSAWAWLRDGQRWQGQLEAQGLRFTLNTGTEIPIADLDRLVTAKPATALPTAAGEKPPATAAQPTHILVELLSGERIAIQPQGSLGLETSWGPLQVAWADLVALQEPAGPEDFGGLLSLRDGTRIRVLGAGTLVLQTLHLGQLELPASAIRRIVTPQAAKLPLDDDEPTASYLELTGGQRLVGRVTADSITLHSSAGPLRLSPPSLRSLRRVDETNPQPPGGAGEIFQAILWGGGTAQGSLDGTRLRVDGTGYSWQIAPRQILRLVNPVPVADPALLRRIASLVQDLGHPSWATREAASAALRELGPLAKWSLREARQTSTDAEIQRRLEELLQQQEEE